MVHINTVGTHAHTHGCREAQQLRALTAPALTGPKFSSWNPCQFTNPVFLDPKNITLFDMCMYSWENCGKSHKCFLYATMAPESSSGKLGYKI